MGPRIKPLEKNVVIFTKGGAIPQIGTGHLVRSVNLARRLIQLGGTRITFLTSTRSELESVAGNLPCSIYEYEENSTNTESLLSVLTSANPEISIIDMLDVPESDLLLLRQKSSIIIALDDTLTVNRHLIDIAVNSLVSSTQADFLGMEYLVLPGPLDEKFTRESEEKRIFVNFGGYDHNRVAINVCHLFSKLKDSSLKINIVVGNSDETFEELLAISSKHANIQIHRDPSDFYNILANSDAALVSGGLIMHTAIYLGVPTYVVSQYEHQELNAINLSDKGAIVDFGRAEFVDLPSAVDQLISDLETMTELSEITRRGKLTIQENGLNRTSEILTIIGVLEWDSRFFGKRIARIYPTKLTQSILDYSLTKAQDSKVDCIFFLCDSNDPMSILLAESGGFHLVDVRVSFNREVPFATPKTKDLQNVCRIANTNDLDALIRISEDFFQLSRYYFDGNFPKSKCKEFYQDWITKSVSGEFDDVVLVAEIEGEIAGFISCKRASRNLGRIGLIGVKKEQAGCGVGNLLLEAAFYWFSEQKVSSVEVVTQGRNIAAQRLYQKNGFKTQKSELWYHKWMNISGIAKIETWSEF